MATSEMACRRAVMASQEVVLENCTETRGAIEEIGPETYAFIPERDRMDFAFDPDEPLDEGETDRAVDSCMDTEFAENWADNVVGEDADPEIRDLVQSQVCQRLFDAVGR